MSTTTFKTTDGIDRTTPETADVVVVGAGFSGLYALHRLRKSGLKVVCFEAGDGVGGTWYWNRYPGARVDLESMQYSYSFDEELEQDWKWPEHFSPQADIEEYINHVADRFDLRRMIRFGARVDRCEFDEDLNRWHVSTDAGHRVTAKYVVAASGSLSATNTPPFPGAETFQGEFRHTSEWPKEGVDYAGKRVGVIGTGATGVQVIPTMAETAGHLHVFQRTPGYSVPANNQALEPAYESEWKQNYTERRELMRQHPNALLLPMYAQHGSVFDHTPEEREKILEEAWTMRSGVLFFFLFNDVMTNIEANEIVAEWFRGKIRQTVKDPLVAEKLCPTTYPLGTKRLTVDTGYYETYNRPNVTLVDVRTDPIVEITPTGLRTTSAEHELDVLVLATGFDAMTGSLTRMNVTGVGGLDLRDKWAERPWNYLGLVVAGFPNLFMVHGPGSPSVVAQMVTGSEYQVDWIADVIEHMERSGIATIDTTPESEAQWRDVLEEAANQTLFPRADSWYVGANIEGKPRSFMIYMGGFDKYSRTCDELVTNGYEGFVLQPDSLAHEISGAATPALAL
jgi:cyclohexanone monooxygenase